MVKSGLRVCEHTLFVWHCSLVHCCRITNQPNYLHVFFNAIFDFPLMLVKMSTLTSNCPSLSIWQPVCPLCGLLASHPSFPTAQGPLPACWRQW